MLEYRVRRLIGAQLQWCMLTDETTKLVSHYRSLQACHVVLASILERASVFWAYCYGYSFKVLRVRNRYPATLQ
jgi:hypothetical protein